MLSCCYIGRAAAKFDCKYTSRFHNVLYFHTYKDIFKQLKQALDQNWKIISYSTVLNFSNNQYYCSASILMFALHLSYFKVIYYGMFDYHNYLLKRKHWIETKMEWLTDYKSFINADKCCFKTLCCPSVMTANPAVDAYISMQW